MTRAALQQGQQPINRNVVAQILEGRKNLWKAEQAAGGTGQLKELPNGAAIFVKRTSGGTTYYVRSFREDRQDLKEVMDAIARNELHRLMAPRQN